MLMINHKMNSQEIILKGHRDCLKKNQQKKYNEKGVTQGALFSLLSQTGKLEKNTNNNGGNKFVTMPKEIAIGVTSIPPDF